MSSNSKHYYCPECDQQLNDNSRWCISCQQRHFEENFDNWTTGDKDIDEFIKETQLKADDADQYLEWIPFSAFINVTKSDISEAGSLFTANWVRGPADTWDPNEGELIAKRNLVKVALLFIGNSPKLFLKELKIHYNGRTRNGLIMRLFGVTRESVTNNLMMVAETVEWDLRHYVSHHFTRLTWQNKIAILYNVVCSLEIQKNGLQQLQNDFSTDYKTVKSHIEIPLNELGLGDSKDLIPVIGYYRYDLLPFISPEIIGGEKYSSKVDIYTFGMLMWEFSSNRPPFYDRPHDAKLFNDIFEGLRPKQRDDCPECYSDLMQLCWSTNPNQRPNVSDLVKCFSDWHLLDKDKEQFINSEQKRIKRVLAKGLNPDPGRMAAPPKVHPQAIYTSRLLKFPALPIPKNTQKTLPKRANSYNDSDNGRTQMSTKDLASILIRDESFFSTAALMQRRSAYPEPEVEPEDEDALKQYELSIPNDLDCETPDHKDYKQSPLELNVESINISQDDSATNGVSTNGATCASPTSIE
ncbi:serine/threonine protein kinase [Gigaspora margarita]|uniref:Serine/threonine protein kinase n=1 Tax=Gigaspora margarita TaxID=4874 RepID=A0A8H4EQ22_GIGMA|nr:serine/threonine protein kinase [Gigaspora margarita]